MTKVKISNNKAEQAQSYFTLFTEFIKIFFGCLLVIFVDQSCSGIDNNQSYLLDYCPSNKTQILSETLTHTCTINENFSDLIMFNQFVLFWNFLTLFIFLWNFIYELKRERYIITNFDYSKLKSIKDIKDVFDLNPDIKNKYLLNTKILYNLNLTCIIVMLLNISFSTVLILYYYYNGFRSVTNLITSILLIIQKLQKNYFILKISYHDEYVQSTILFRPYFYNTLDKDKFNINENENENEKENENLSLKKNELNGTNIESLV